MAKSTVNFAKLAKPKSDSLRVERGESKVATSEEIINFGKLVTAAGGFFSYRVKLTYKGKAKREWRERLKRWDETRSARVHKRDRPKCGARCRDGHACNARAVWNDAAHAPVNGRCRMHGGLSTGARTPEGLERIRSAQLERWRRWRAEKLLCQ